MGQSREVLFVFFAYALQEAKGSFAAALGLIDLEWAKSVFSLLIIRVCLPCDHDKGGVQTSVLIIVSFICRDNFKLFPRGECRGTQSNDRKNMSDTRRRCTAMRGA